MTSLNQKKRRGMIHMKTINRLNEIRNFLNEYFEAVQLFHYDHYMNNREAVYEAYTDEFYKGEQTKDRQYVKFTVNIDEVMDTEWITVKTVYYAEDDTNGGYHVDVIEEIFKLTIEGAERVNLLGNQNVHSEKQYKRKAYADRYVINLLNEHKCNLSKAFTA